MMGWRKGGGVGMFDWGDMIDACQLDSWDDSPSDFECWRCHGGELGGDGEDAVEFAVRERCCHGGGDAGEDSG